MEQKLPLIVGFPLYPQCTLVDFAGATQIFATPPSGFKPVWLAKNKGEIETTEGVSVMPNYSFDDYQDDIDILFVPGGSFQGVANAMQDDAFLKFLRERAPLALWSGSVCTGAFVLAAAGILRNCLATTYWEAIPILKMLSQKLNLEIPDGYPRYLAGDSKKPFTGGGISSSLDLALEIVYQINKEEAAQKSQLFAQYQPKPRFHAGDPDGAPANIVADLRKGAQKDHVFLIDAVKKLLANPNL